MGCAECVLWNEKKNTVICETTFNLFRICGLRLHSAQKQRHAAKMKKRPKLVFPSDFRYYLYLLWHTTLSDNVLIYLKMLVIFCKNC